jgi:methylmalonyl-CoA/ethylmalonyl-CoA epimerase
MNSKFHHIGMACHSIDDTAQFYLSMGYQLSDTIFDPIQNVNIAFLNKENETCIELIEPCDDNSPVTSILKKNGTSPYHLCYKVDNIEVAINEMKLQKFIRIGRIALASAMENGKICFMYSRDKGLIELYEPNEFK